LHPLFFNLTQVLSLDVIFDHQAEREGIEDVEELVLREVVVGGQVQRGDKLVLQVAALPALGVEAKRLTQGQQELSKLIQVDE